MGSKRNKKRGTRKISTKTGFTSRNNNKITYVTNCVFRVWAITGMPFRLVRRNTNGNDIYKWATRLSKPMKIEPNGRNPINNRYQQRIWLALNDLIYPDYCVNGPNVPKNVILIKINNFERDPEWRNFTKHEETFHLVDENKWILLLNWTLTRRTISR